MDINCTNNCQYQSDGKCTMNQLPSASQSVYSSDESIDCPYFLSK